MSALLFLNSKHDPNLPVFFRKYIQICGNFYPHPRSPAVFFLTAVSDPFNLKFSRRRRGGNPQIHSICGVLPPHPDWMLNLITLRVVSKYVKKNTKSQRCYLSAPPHTCDRYHKYMSPFIATYAPCDERRAGLWCSAGPACPDFIWVGGM